MNKVKVRINVAGREYPMSVTPNEEEVLREAGKKINHIIKDFEERYSVKDKQDCLAMCALQYVAKTIRLERSAEELEKEQCKEIDRLIQQINRN